MAKVHASIAIHVEKRDPQDVWWREAFDWKGEPVKVRIYWLEAVCGTYAGDESWYKYGNRTPVIHNKKCMRGVTCKNCRRIIAARRRIKA